MDIIEIKDNKKRYLSLLLAADEDEDMIDRYLERGVMYVLCDGEVCAECVVSDEGGGVLEIKNIAVELSCRRRGYGRALIEYLTEVYAGKFAWLQVGTGESPLTLPFYESCGFKYSHRAKDFFTKNYKRPIYEGGVLLKDMVFLRRRL